MPRPFNEGAAVIVHYLGTTATGVVERIEGRASAPRIERMLEPHLGAA